MNGIIAPTDSRYREDLRLMENGSIEESDEIRDQIEELSRRQYKYREENRIKWRCKFFEKEPHPHLKNNNVINTLEFKPVFYHFKTDYDNGYWERRKRSDWSDMPKLWGPFDLDKSKKL